MQVVSILHSTCTVHKELLLVVFCCCQKSSNFLPVVGFPFILPCRCNTGLSQLNFLTVSFCRCPGFSYIQYYIPNKAIYQPLLPVASYSCVLLMTKETECLEKDGWCLPETIDKCRVLITGYFVSSTLQARTGTGYYFNYVDIANERTLSYFAATDCVWSIISV